MTEVFKPRNFLSLWFYCGFWGLMSMQQFWHELAMADLIVYFLVILQMVGLSLS